MPAPDKPDNLEGVFVDGKPLTKFLEDAERDDKSREIEEIRKKDSQKEKLTVVYSDERAEVDTRKVSKRVRRFTDREIRKEYGIMQKPFNTTAENAIWIIMEKGPLSVKDIGNELKWEGKNNTLSAMIATIWQRLGNMHEGAFEILDRSRETGKFFYRKADGIDVSVEAAIQKYHHAGTTKYRKDTKGLRPKDKVAEDKFQDKMVDNSLITKIMPEGENALKIKISGRVDIVFRFER